MIAEWLIREPSDNKIENAVIMFAGRGNGTEMMIDMAEDMALPNTVCIAVRGHRYQWYPSPTSSSDQADAVAGIPAAHDACAQLINRVGGMYSLNRNRIVIGGYSAGGVMTNELVFRAVDPFAAAIVFCGAVLEPRNIPVAGKKTTPMFVVHKRDDYCFKWGERYLPMKNTLRRQKYNVEFKEDDFGGHLPGIADVVAAGYFAARNLGIKNFEHPRVIEYRRRRAEEEALARATVNEESEAA